MKFISNKRIQFIGNCIHYITSSYIFYNLINYKGSLVTKFIATFIGIIWLCALLFPLVMGIIEKLKTNKNN